MKEVMLRMELDVQSVYLNMSNAERDDDTQVPSLLTFPGLEFWDGSKLDILAKTFGSQDLVYGGNKLLPSFRHFFTIVLTREIEAKRKARNRAMTSRGIRRAEVAGRLGENYLDMGISSIDPSDLTLVDLKFVLSRLTLLDKYGGWIPMLDLPSEEEDAPTDDATEVLQGDALEAKAMADCRSILADEALNPLRAELAWEGQALGYITGVVDARKGSNGRKAMPEAGVAPNGTCILFITTLSLS